MQGLFIVYSGIQRIELVRRHPLKPWICLKDVKGKKSIVVLASGRGHLLQTHPGFKTMKQLRQSDVTIFCIGLGRSFQITPTRTVEWAAWLA